MKIPSGVALTVLLLLLVVGSFEAMRPQTVEAQAQGPVVRTAQPLYTLREREVMLSGSGFTSGTFHIWLRRPGVNASAYTGVFFAPVTGGLIPPSTIVQLTPEDPLGTYLVSVSISDTSDTAVAQAHFGVWGTSRALYQRTETVRISGGGLYPSGGGKVTVRNPAGTFVHDQTVLANERGEFSDQWRIPADSSLDVYSVFIDGTGTSDDATQEFLSLARFTVAPATLSVVIVNQPAPFYERTTTAVVVLQVKYPDGSAVDSLKSGVRPLGLVQDASVVASLNLTRLDPVSGTWRAEVKIPANASLGTGYRFRLPNGGFDDGFGNVGGGDEILSNIFEIRPASFRIEAMTNQSSYQIGFDSIKIQSIVNYPDGTPLVNGTVLAVISLSGWSAEVPLVYDGRTETWVGVYSISLLDLTRIGSWKITVRADDQYANLGQAELLVSVQPVNLAIVLVTVAVLALLVNWLLKRYWRRVSLRIKKVTLSIRRGRLKPGGIAYSFTFPS